MQQTTRIIAKRIYKSLGDNPKVISSLAIKISVSGIALGLAVIILSFAIILGFKKEVRQKIYGFTSDIRICNLDYATSYAANPIDISDSLLASLGGIDAVRHVQTYSTTPGMVKPQSGFQGMILKGISNDYDTTFLSSSLIEGSMPAGGGGKGGYGIIVSKTMSDKLGLKTGDAINAYFFNQTLKARKLTVTGIYQTNINEHDDLFVITSKDVVDKINGWQATQATGIEIALRPGADTYAAIDSISMTLRSMPQQDNLSIETPEDIYPDIFSWLDILDTNVIVILILMIGLSIFSIISGLLIILLEKVNTIGILKALGADNRYVKRVFSHISVLIVTRGVIWGNAIGLGLYAVERCFRLFALNPVIYYVDHVPVDITVWHIVAINALVIGISLAVFVLPSIMISKITPARTIKFD